MARNEIIMEYTVQITVRVCADTVNDAHRIIKHALEHAKLAEIIYLDSEVLESKTEEDSEIQSIAHSARKS